MIDIVATVMIVLGGAFCAVAGIGVVRLPDVLMRMHASTKAGTLGAGLVLGGVALHFVDVAVTAKALLVIAFLLLTAPVAAHLVGRAAWRTGSPLDPRTAHHAKLPAHMEVPGGAPLSPSDARSATQGSATSDPPA